MRGGPTSTIVSRTVLDIFLSSTSTDLEPYRAKVREEVERLGQASVCIETFGARPARPLTVCKAEVERSDALIVIVGHRYGWVPSAQDGGDGEKSITWWEVTWALAHQKPVYAFLVDPKMPWPGDRESDRLGEPGADASEVQRAVRALQKFRASLESLQTRELFGSPDDLGGKVATSLHTWLVDERVKLLGRTSSPHVEHAPSTQPRPTWTGSPFPGLRAFTPDDAPIFFGRDRETDALVRKLCDSTCRFILIVGTSGSGKSSLVAAGLIPRLAAGAVPGSHQWLLPQVHAIGVGKPWLGLRFTPAEQGDDPFQALAAKLAPMLPEAPPPQDVARSLHDDPDALVRLLERALAGKPSTAEVLILVDQFEELVTQVAEHDARGRDRQTRFVTMMAAAIRSPTSCCSWLRSSKQGRIALARTSTS